MKTHLVKRYTATCPECGDACLRKGSMYKSIPAASNFWCENCGHKFVIQYHKNDRNGPESQKSRCGGDVFSFGMKPVVFGSVDEYKNR